MKYFIQHKKTCVYFLTDATHSKRGQEILFAYTFLYRKLQIYNREIMTLTYSKANHDHAIFFFLFTLMSFIRNLEKIVITIPFVYIWKNMKELLEII